MNVKASIVAQKLLNLYRQEHVIVGGWAAVNKVFVDEAAPDVIAALQALPTGGMLSRHIENLRNGTTAMDSIERDLLPYGGAMSENVLATPINEDEFDALESAILSFTPDEAGLDALQSNPAILQFGDEWPTAVRAALAGKPDLQNRWSVVQQTYQAYKLWNTANEVMQNPISDRTRAQLQTDMPEYETYLPMFGDAGNELLAKLRTFVSSIKPANNQPAEPSPESVTETLPDTSVSSSSSEVL